MSIEPAHAVGPRRSTWTHIALCVKDIDASIAWYERFTHLRLLSRGEDNDGKNAWLGDSTKEAVDEVAARGKAEGCLAFGPLQMPKQIGYICFLKDPDGNTIEYSFDQ